MSNKKMLSGWINHAWRKEDADANVIRLQKKFIGILCVISLGLYIGWMRAPSDLTIHIPPDIQNGATIKVGNIPTSLIYSFAYEIWQEMNYWPQDGELDYQKNIHTYWSYLTPQFKSDLLAEYEDLKISGQAQRIRYLQGMNGAAFDPVNVKKLGNDTWEVDLKMRMTEYKNNQPVKDVEILYPLKVTRINVSPKNNPYGLALAGFAAEPVRLKTYI
ncbi:MAG: PFL_4703 family integrating conjugative element protein [Gammaproteobacteria bacterium]